MNSVVRGVSFDVPAGGTLGILGPNGSGKSTLLKLVAGTLRPTRGRVTLDDVDLRAHPRGGVARRIASVPQETHPAFDYTALEIVLMGRYPHLGAFELEGPDDLALAHEALAATGTEAFAHRPFATLSGGEKQRVIIASALAQLRRRADETAGGGEMLLLDEPTTALDLGYQIEIAALVDGLRRERGIALIVATHDLGLAAGLCDRLLLLRDGEAIADGPTREVLTAANLRTLFGVDAEVVHHPRAAHPLVVPVKSPEGGGARL